MTRSERSRLTDIRDRIDAISVAEALLNDGLDSDTGRIAFDAILYSLVVIGEAVKHLSSEVRNRHSHLPWSEITRLRDRLAHHYTQVDPSIIRRTIDRPLRDLRSIVETELDRSPLA